MPPAAIPGAPPSSRPPKPKGNYNPSPTILRGSLAGLPKRPPSDRVRHLTPRQVRELVNVEGFAEAQGVAFAVHVTIHWQCDPDFDPATWGKRTTRFLDKLCRWLDRHDIRVAYAWAHEVGSHYGEHTHLLLHLPKAKKDVIRAYHALKAELEAWIITTENFVTDKIDWRGKPWLPVKITPDKPHHFGMRTAKMRAGTFVYLLEGIDPDDIAYRGHGTEARASAMGIRPKANAKPIPIQRYGASRSLGPKARRDAGWRELTSLEDFYTRLHPA